MGTQFVGFIVAKCRTNLLVLQEVVLNRDCDNRTDMQSKKKKAGKIGIDGLRCSKRSLNGFIKKFSCFTIKFGTMSIEGINQLPMEVYVVDKP
mmetsp:Transcript_4990/g.11100  ORF Transcript_4990/g.11100 Transcript_4990/m.11100 type:complete len:93 (+) Transcript_4990:1581-1859(+)